MSNRKLLTMAEQVAWAKERCKELSGFGDDGIYLALLEGYSQGSDDVLFKLEDIVHEMQENQ